jgi:hypothetical protein
MDCIRYNNYYSDLLLLILHIVNKFQSNELECNYPTEHLLELRIARCSVMLQANTKDSFVVIEGRTVSHEYVIPKDEVDHYDGRELSLKMRHDEIGSDYEHY